MRAVILALGLMVSALVIASAAQAADPPKSGRAGMPVYDASTEVTLSGAVDKITEHRHGRMQGKHLWLKTASETIEVHLGPAAFLAKEKFAVSPSDQIEVTGSRVKIEGADALIARSVKKGETTWALRDGQGVPNWARGRARRRK